MPAAKTTLTTVMLLLIAIASHGIVLADDTPQDATTDESPQAVVSRWLELHRTGKRDEASALTTGSHYHRAKFLLSSKRDTGVRVERSLGNERAAAVVTGSLRRSRDGERVLLFWLVRRGGQWRINKSDAFKRQVVDERLRGFWEAGDVRWHIQHDKLLGFWESGPWRPPGGSGIACGSRLQLREDSRFRLAAWGPGGPHPEYDDVMQGKWRIVDGVILLSHQGKTHECRVTWVTGELLTIEPLGGQGHAAFERIDPTESSLDAAADKLDRE